MTKFTFSLFIFILSYASTFAQSGNIQGIITDDNGITIPGAAVVIQDVKKGAISDMNGKYTLVNIPVGIHTIQIQYLGYTNITKEVEIFESTTTSLDFVLKSQATTLDEVKIIGYTLGGQARALNTQKNKMNITTIVSTDQIGKFPDANIGDAIKRIPGITMQVDQGEARNIIVRGMSPQLNSVTLNGSRIPSAEGDNRNVQMDLIPSDMIQTVEVNKAVTPDMEGDALGGSINLITKTAPQGFRLSATAGSGVNFITDKRIINGSLLVGDRSKNGKFGWMLSASINDNDFGSDNVESEWEDEFEYNAFNDEDNLEEVTVNPYAKTFEIREYLVQRVRRSFAANMDYKLNENNSLFIKSIYNWRDDRENRFRLEHEILDGEDIAPGDFSIDRNGNLTSFPAEIKRQSKGGIAGGRNKNRRLEDQRMQNYSLGGDHLLNSLQIDWMASYAKASEERLNERYLEYENEYRVNYNNNPKKPLYTPFNASDAALSNFEFGELTEENQYTEEKDMNFFINFKLPANWFDEETGFVKFGGRARLKNKNRDNDFNEFSPNETKFEYLSGLPTKDYSDKNFSAGSQYAVGSFASAQFLGSLDLTNPTHFESEDLPEEYLTGNFDVDENVFAGYAMFNQYLSPKLSLLAGLRVEHTQINSTGHEIIYNEDGDFDGTNILKSENNYTNFLPGVHLKFDATPQTILRFAWTNTIARPNYMDLVPYREVNNEDEEIVLGNPDLDPTRSMNFDLMAEHYFESVGILSAGVFYKDIKDFTYVYQYEDENNYEVYQPFNGEDASVVGFEISLQRQLDFLPGFAKNFSLYLNYTHLTSDANGIRNEDGEERTDLDLPNTAPHLFNASLGYATKHMSFRLSGNFSDAYMDEIGGRPFEDRYYDKQFFLDFNASINIHKNLSLYADLNNITNQPLRYYQGVSQRTMQMEYYQTRFTIGLKYDLFKSN
ncbi:TonB-dependent receptor [Flavobacteriaceae bacterium F08102]|nr:TonB-dependent receptor [Flavobacteriaceae bacterium F08102]